MERAWYVSLNGLLTGLESVTELDLLVEDLRSQPQQKVIAVAKKGVAAQVELALLRAVPLPDLGLGLLPSCNFLVKRLESVLPKVAEYLDELFRIDVVKTSVSYEEMCSSWSEDGSLKNEDHIQKGIAIDQQEEAMKIDVWTGAAQVLKQYSPTSAPAWLEQSSSLELLHGGFSSFCSACAAWKSFCALDLAEKLGNDANVFDKLAPFVAALQAFTKEFCSLRQRATAKELIKSLAGLSKNLEAIRNYTCLVVVFRFYIFVLMLMPDLLLGC